jgi:ABC-2 type transport system ATP-binding protein
LSAFVTTLLVAASFATVPAASAQAPTALDPSVPCDRRADGFCQVLPQQNFWIPVSTPDMYGDPVQLDASLLVPKGPGPFAGFLINHGYLGSKSGDGDTARKASERGYIVLRYSSRGFGETKGQVNLVGPAETQDMVEAVQWLNNPANVPSIWVDHIGQYGGSYGGAHALNLARRNLPAVRAVVPAATWHDLHYGLLPNGVLKVAYESGFYAAGRLRTDGYNNYDPAIDTGYAQAASSADMDGLKATLQSRSVVDKWSEIKPTTAVFLAQGLNDGLFSGNDAIETFQHLQAQGVPVRLYLGGLGHPPSRSGGGNEIGRVEYEVMAWLDHYVREMDNGIEDEAPIEFALTQYFDNPDVPSTALAEYKKRVFAATSFPFGAQTALHICGATPGTGALSSAPCPDALPVLLSAGTGGSPGDEPVGARLITEGFQEYFGRPFPPLATPVDVVTLDGAPLTADTMYAGNPTLNLKVISDPPTTGAGGPTPPAAAYQVVPKIYDVAPDGTATLITRGAFAEQPGEGAPGVHDTSFDAFTMAWTFKAGHRVRMTLSSADVPYLRPNAAPFQVAILPGSTVEMPGAEDATARIFGAPGGPVEPTPVVPEAPVALLLPLAAVAAAGAWGLRSRRMTALARSV